MIYARRILFFSLVIFCELTVANAAEVGDIAADWSLSNVQNDTLNFYNDSAENVSVILFWATWCPFCRSLMPHLQELANKYEGKAVKFYALNIWEDGNPVTYMKKNGFTFTLLLKADSVTNSYYVKGTPGLFVVNQKHEIVYKRISGEDNTDVKEAVDYAINSSVTKSNI